MAAAAVSSLNLSFFSDSIKDCFASSSSWRIVCNCRDGSRSHKWRLDGPFASDYVINGILSDNLKNKPMNTLKQKNVTVSIPALHNLVPLLYLLQLLAELLLSI
ncbi:hypothetical protein Hanom_Chr08g00683541 [Helianthus anomalus]